MAKKRTWRDFFVNDCIQFYNYMMAERPTFQLLVPLVLFGWAVERWILPFSNWVPLLVCVWATIQYGSYQRQVLVEDLKRKWKQVMLNKSPATPLEHCEWLNKLLMEVWPEFINPRLSIRFSSIVEKRLKHRIPRFIEKIELQDFSFGSSPLSWGCMEHVGQLQRIMRMGFDWDTNDISIMLFTKLAKPLRGTARIVINSIHIKGDLLLRPILNGKAILYSFESTPEVRIGIAFGSGGSQTLPATELPGVSSWLVKVFTDTLAKRMVEPRRRCYSLPSLDLRKKAVGGILSVKVVSATKLVRNNMKRSFSASGRQQSSGRTGFVEEENLDDNDMQTFIEVELEELTRRTAACPGSSPRWDAYFNMVLHEDTGTLKFHLYECIPSSVKYDYIASCEIQMKYVIDDSTTFWGIGPGSSVVAKHVEYCGKEVEMVIPFEDVNSGELTVRLVLKEWQFSDGSNNSLDNKSHLYSQHSSSNIQSMTGRKLIVTVVEGKDLIAKDRSGKCDPYVKLQYGKTLHKTGTIPHATNPVWNHKFEFDEVGGGEYLKIKCFSEDTFGDDNIGNARINLEGLVEGSLRDVWVPLEKVNSGEIRLQIEAVRDDNQEGSRGAVSGSNGCIELVVIEAKDLIAADLRGTSDPYVRIHYGNLKKRTKVLYQTLNPKWNQTLEFPEDGSPLMLHVKDHNALLPSSSIGDCVVEYKGLLPNETADKWIPLQGVKKGEIHIQITRKVPELQKKPSLDSYSSDLSKANVISVLMKQKITELRNQINNGDPEGLSLALHEIETLEDVQEDYMLQLETEKMLMLEKISMLGEEIDKSSPSQNGRNHLSE